MWTHIVFVRDRVAFVVFAETAWTQMVSIKSCNDSCTLWWKLCKLAEQSSGPGGYWQQLALVRQQAVNKLSRDVSRICTYSQVGLWLNICGKSTVVGRGYKLRTMRSQSHPCVHPLCTCWTNTSWYVEEQHVSVLLQGSLANNVDSVSDRSSLFIISLFSKDQPGM